MIKKITARKRRLLFSSAALIILCGVCMTLLSHIMFSHCSDIAIHPVVSAILKQIPVEKSYIKKLPKYNNVNYYLDMPIIGTEELSEYILWLTDGVEFDDLAEEDVKSLLDILGVDSADEFYSCAYEKAVERKKVQQILNARKEVLQELRSQTVFVIDRDEIAQYAVDIVRLYEMYKTSSGSSLDEYIDENFSSREEFFSMCYDEAKQKVENYLLIGAICNAENIDVDTDGSEGDSLYYQQLENDFYALFINAAYNY